MKQEIPDTNALRDAVLTFFTEGVSKRYNAYNMGKKFGVTTTAMREVLDSLVDSKQLDWYRVDAKHGRMYTLAKKGGAPSHQALRDTVLESAKKVGSVKTYVPGPEWDYVNERLKEFRKYKSKF